ncbi:MAG: azurin [Opitutaceae bacterium]|nr:azurin [Opitutaceae bacterium]
MKNCLIPVALVAASLLSACGKKDAAPASAPAAAPAAAAAAPAAAAPAAKAAAAPRVIEITANDQMKFSLATIEAKAGEELKIVLNNIGMLPKEAMGHNWVLLKAGTDVTAFATAAMTAKDTDYVPAAMKDKVIAFIPVLGPKKSADVTFTAPAPGDYVYICSFPGHYMIMKGTLTVK